MRSGLAVLAALAALALAGCGGSAAGQAAAPRPSTSATSTSAPPTQVDPNGLACVQMDPAGYCPGDDPSQTDPSGNACPSLDSAGYCPGDDPSPTAAPITKVEFIVTGYAPNAGCGSSCGPTVDWGSDSDTHDVQLSSLDGTVTYSMPFDPGAQFYSLNAQLSGGGHVTCKIVAIGPSPDVPTTVSHGSASGGSAICSAQAAPQDPAGANWTDEQ